MLNIFLSYNEKNINNFWKKKIKWNFLILGIRSFFYNVYGFLKKGKYYFFFTINKELQKLYKDEK